MKSTSQKNLAVIRGPRESLVGFYKQFENLKISYVAASFEPLEEKSFQKGTFSFSNLPMYQPFGIDPFLHIPAYRNLNWSFTKGVEEIIANSDALSISDTYYFLNLQAIMLAQKKGIPIVTDIWTTIPHHITSWFPPYSWITRKVVSSTNLFLLRSQTAIRFTDSLGISHDKIKVIYKGVDLELFNPIAKKETNEIKILFTGNLSPAKGLDDLLAVFKVLYRKYPVIRLVIAGSGPLSEVVKNTPGVEYKGFLHYTQLAKSYNIADIFCAPSKRTEIIGIPLWEEYFSYALMEAQAAGLPIVTTQTGGIPEEVSSDNFLIRPGDRQELYRAIENLIKDKQKRIALGWANRKRAERFFDQKKQANETEKAIEYLL